MCANEMHLMQKFLCLNSPRPLPVPNPTHCWFDIHKVTETGTKFVNGSFNLFSRIKTIEFKTTRHHDAFPRVLMKKVSIGWVKGLVPNRRQAITWTNDNQDIWGHCSRMAPMVSDILVNTDSSTGMTPRWCQAITSTSHILLLIKLIYSLTPEQKGRHFADGISNAFSWIKLVQFNSFSLKYIPVVNW